ncbi:hypothetical protein SprV_0301063100 [Sparganum proliferum]
MPQQPGNVNFSPEHPYYHPCRKHRDDDRPGTTDQTADAPSPLISDIIRPALTPALTTATSSANTTASRNLPVDGTTLDVPSSTTITIDTPHLRRCGLGLNLSSL